VEGQVRGFGQTAQGLARTPLGIIALFIVLVYGFAALVTTFGGALTSAERAPLIYFLVLFPVLVLCVFAWLLTQHRDKILFPADFKDDKAFLSMMEMHRVQLSAVASLTAASSKGTATLEGQDLDRIVEVVQQSVTAKASEVAVQAPASDEWRKRILWVDDRPENNVYERQAFEALGLNFTLSLDTTDALDRLSRQKFATVISDMGRKEGPREGYALLDAMRQRGDQTPLFIYANSNAPEHKRETREHGGQGCTNSPNELFQLVTRSVISAAG